MTPLIPVILVPCLAVSRSAQAPPQVQPAPPASQSLPPAARVEGGAVKDLDNTTVNLDWENVTVADLPLLERFPALRRLQINPHADGDVAWRSVQPDALAPVCNLPALENLTLPYCAHLSPEHLRRLSACKRLESVLFLNESLSLGADEVAVLARWPALRSLRLSLITVTPAGLAGLAKLPRLELLALEHCRGLDAAGMASVGELAKLRTLSLAGLGKPDLLARFKGLDPAPSWALTAAAMRQIAAMPALRELELQECVLEPRLLTGLSPQLRALKLNGQGVDAQALRDLRGHGSLRELELREAGGKDAEREQFGKEVAGLLGTLHLERFRWHGAVTVDLRQAIAGLADLRELAVPCGPGLQFLTVLPKLERLELWPRVTALEGAVAGERGHPTPAEFAPLQTSKSLRIIAYHDGKLPAGILADLRRALGPRIELQLVD